MLASIISHENPGLESQKLDLVNKIAEGSYKLKLVEDEILKLLIGIDNIKNLLSDSNLITSLSNSQ